MAFNRVLELSVGSAGVGLLISDLNISFTIERSISFSENTAEFTVYNAKEDTRKNILKEGNNLIFKAGYEDEAISTIYIGNITKSVSRLMGADWVTVISSSSVVSPNTPLKNTYVSLSYNKGTFISSPLRDIGIALGLIVLGLENVALISLSEGFTFVGSAREALRQCKKILEPKGIALYIDNTEIVIYNVGGRISRFAPVYLTYNTGLINVEEIEEYDTESPENPKKIAIESLIIPRLQPNSLVTIVSESIRGTFLIEKVTFEGDNFGGQNICRCEAIE